MIYVVRFKTDEGKTQEIENQNPQTEFTPAYQVGDSVWVKYVSGNPQEGRIDSFREQVEPLLSNGLGLIVDLGLLLASFYYRRSIIAFLNRGRLIY
jgi:hypothetical protein